MESEFHCAQSIISLTSVVHLLCTRNHLGYNIDWNPAQNRYLVQIRDNIDYLTPNTSSADNLVM